MKERKNERKKEKSVKPRGTEPVRDGRIFRGRSDSFFRSTRDAPTENSNGESWTRPLCKRVSYLRFVVTRIVIKCVTCESALARVQQGHVGDSLRCVYSCD